MQNIPLHSHHPFYAHRSIKEKELIYPKTHPSSKKNSCQANKKQTKIKQPFNMKLRIKEGC
jgi:hypothetical protein